MSEPDELYTLRAQYWLGHYQMAIDEAKSIARRPMSSNLKAEREEFLARSYIALGQYDRVAAMTGDTPALNALAIKARYEAAVGDDAAQERCVDEMKSLVGSNTTPSVQLTACQLLLKAGQTKEALQCVHLGSTMEHIANLVQIYLKLDRLDLARDQYAHLKQADEDSILTQLCSVYVHLVTGSSAADDAIHTLNSLAEQYGPTPLLLNLMACAFQQAGDYQAAETKLQECLRDHATDTTALPETLVNLVAVSVQLKKPADAYVAQMQQQYPHHAFCKGLERVNTAFDREALKYRVAA